jgi:hypothetical protein
MSGGAAGAPLPFFCSDEQMGYSAARTRLPAGAPLTLDESYRRAHLPLVNPAHPDVIAASATPAYAMGRHDPVASLVLPLDPDALEASPAWAELDAALRKSAFAGKLAWGLLPLRRARLHATICGNLGNGGALPATALAALEAVGSFAVEVRGLFSGNVNVGRLYLRLYPQLRQGGNPVHQFQAALGRPPGNLQLAGLHNLTDHLDPDETKKLLAIIEQWWPRVLTRITVTELWVLSSCDDLVLDSEIVHRIRLG